MRSSRGWRTRACTVWSAGCHSDGVQATENGGFSMETLRMTRCESVWLAPDPRRVITKPFLPLNEIYMDGSTRMQDVLHRIMALSDDDVSETLNDSRALFAGRHTRPRSRVRPKLLRRRRAPRRSGPRTHCPLGRSASTDRRLLHARVLGRGGGACQPVDRGRTRSVRARRWRAPVRHEPAVDRRGAHVVDRVPNWSHQRRRDGQARPTERLCSDRHAQPPRAPQVALHGQARRSGDDERGRSSGPGPASGSVHDR